MKRGGPADRELKEALVSENCCNTGAAELEGRVLLAQAISHGVEPPEYLEPGLLIRGAVHRIFAGPASGKTWLALLLIRNALKRGLTVAFFDTENGERIISERLATLRVDVSTVVDLLFYYPSPSLDLSAANSFAEFLDTVKPDLIVFDSWLDHLASANLSENESTDIAKWAGVLRQAVLPRLREFGPPAHREF